MRVSQQPSPARRGDGDDVEGDEDRVRRRRGDDARLVDARRRRSALVATAGVPRCLRGVGAAAAGADHAVDRRAGAQRGGRCPGRRGASSGVADGLGRARRARVDELGDVGELLRRARGQPVDELRSRWARRPSAAGSRTGALGRAARRRAASAPGEPAARDRRRRGAAATDAAVQEDARARRPSRRSATSAVPLHGLACARRARAGACPRGSRGRAAQFASGSMAWAAEMLAQPGGVARQSCARRGVSSCDRARSTARTRCGGSR